MRRPRAWHSAGSVRLAAALTALATALALALLGGLPAAAADPPSLSMTSSVSPNPMIVGGTANYTVTVTNTGSPATGVVTTTLPFSGGALTFGTLPAGCVISNAANQIVTCTAASIAAGASVDYLIPVTLSPGLSDGTNIALRGTATSPGLSGANTQLIVQAFTSTDVAITKTGPATVNPNGTITWAISVVNNGPSNAVSVTWHDQTDGNLTTLTSVPCGDTGLTVSCNVGTMAPGDVRNFTITATVKPSVPAGTVIPNCVVVYTGSRESNTNNNQSCMATTVTGAPPPPMSDVEVVKTGPATVMQGGTISYTQTITNSGPDPATNVIMNDPINPLFTGGSSLPPGCTVQDTTLSCTRATLGVGESWILTGTATIGAAVPVGTHVTNCASVSAAGTDATQGENSSCVQTTVIRRPVAALQITKSGPATADPGDTFSYTLTVTNNGPDNASGVTVTDPTNPSLVTVVSPPAGCTVSAGTVTCDIGTLAAGDSRSVTITVIVGDGVAPSTVIQNCDAVASSATDPNGSDTSGCVNTLVAPPVPVAQVQVTKTGPLTAHAGDTITYTVNAKNLGPDTATDVLVKDPLNTAQVTAAVLPAECFLSVNTVICDAGTLAVGDTKTFTLTATVVGSLTPGTQIDNCGSATSTSTVLTPVAQSDCVTTVILSPATANVSIAKTGPLTAAPGGTITYTIRASNAGPDDAADVVVTDALNPALVTVTGLPAGCTETAGTVTCQVGTLAAGDARIFILSVRVNPGIEGVEIPNCAQVYTSTTDSGLGGNQSCLNTSVGITTPASATVLVAKHGPAAANADGTISYSIDVTNRGPDNATDVVLTDPVNSPLVSVTALPAACVLDAGTITCLAGTLAVGQTKTFTVTEHVAAGAKPGAQISNCANVGSEVAAVRDTSAPDCTQTVVLPAAQVRLEITKTAPRTVRPGGLVTYHVTLANRGPDAAQGVVVKDPIRNPSLIRLVSMPPECSISGVTVTCSLPTLAAGETRHFTATIRVRSDVTGGTVLGNCIAVYSVTQDTDPDLGDIQSCVNTVVQRKPDVTVLKKGPATTRADGTAGYTITATNLGPDPATGVVVTDQVAQSLVTVESLPGDCSLAHGLITCRAGTLRSGQSAAFRITVTVDASLKTGTRITNCAEVTSDPAAAKAGPVAQAAAVRRSCTVARVTGLPTVPVTG